MDEPAHHPGCFGALHWEIYIDTAIAIHVYKYQSAHIESSSKFWSSLPSPQLESELQWYKSLEMRHNQDQVQSPTDNFVTNYINTIRQPSLTLASCVITLYHVGNSLSLERSWCHYYSDNYVFTFLYLDILHVAPSRIS